LSTTETNSGRGLDTMKQKNAVLEYAKRHPNGFTTCEAVRDLFITHVHRAVKELEQDGWAFDRKTVKFEGGARYYKYNLIPKEA